MRATLYTHPDRAGAVLLSLKIDGRCCRGGKEGGSMWQQEQEGKLHEGARPDVGADVWEVDRLLEKRRCKGGRVEYLVKWRGWEARFNSWEPSRPVLSSE